MLTRHSSQLGLASPFGKVFDLGEQKLNTCLEER